jgi:hypothetical protein
MGPAAGAAWRELSLGDGVSVCVLPDAPDGRSGNAPSFHYLAARPRLARSGAGGPQLSLTLELARPPATGEPTILPLVERGWLALTLTFGLSPAERAALERMLGAPCRALFARAARIELASDGAVLAAVDGAGAEPPMALSAQLPRAAALGVLAALDGDASGLRVSGVVTYRTAPVTTRLRLAGGYAEIHAFLAERCDAGGFLDARALLAALRDLLHAKVLRATREQGPSVPPLPWTDVEALLPRFVGAASPILRSHEAGSRYSLRGAPSPLMRLDVTEEIAAAAESRWTASAPLESVLGGALAGVDRDRYVHLVAPGARGPVADVPRLVRSRRAPARMRAREPRRIRVAANGGAYASLALAMTPDRHRAPSAHALLSTDLVRTPATSPLIALADDFVIDRLEGPQAAVPFPLPVVGDAAAPVWPDRVEQGKYWYAPGWSAALPEPSADPATAPFLFSFAASGVTGGGSPAVGLDGTVRFTLQRAMPEAARERLEALGRPPAEPLPTQNASVSLDLPFRDEATGEVRRQLFGAEVEQAADGTMTATVSLLNQWVRLCYGALAYPGFQEEPARVRVAYAYRAYVPIEGGRLELAFGGKIALTEIAGLHPRRTEPAATPVFEPGNLTFHLPHGALRLQREAPAKRPRPPAAAAHLVAAHAVQPLHAAATAAVLARPELAVDASDIAPVNVRYATRTFVRDEAVDVLYPCATLGAFYRQAHEGLDAAVGCRDTLRLGEAVHRQYEELADHRSDRYRVYRSLQQPGRFLVVPAAYRITRYAAQEPADRAFRPAIMIYAILGEEPAAHAYFFRATLEPDLPPFVRRDLEERLSPLVPHGARLVLTYPTDPTLQNGEFPAAFRWALPAGIDLPEVLQTWDGFQVSLSTGLTNAVALTTLIESSGLAGDVTFTLPDGHPVTSSLLLDTNVTGPWETGAVSAAVDGAVARLTNHTERQMNVFDLVLGAGPSRRHHAVDVVIEPRSSVDVPIAPGESVAYASYEPAGAAVPLARMNIFIEDVTTNVIFVNLINYANHGLGGLRVKARLADTPQQHVVELAEGTSGSLTLTLPLTTYLERKVLEFQVDKTFADRGEPETTPWLQQDLSVSNVVSLTWELVA